MQRTATNPFSTEHQYELIQRYQSGDEQAFNQLLEENQKLIHKQAQHYSRSPVPYEYIFQAGVQGMMEAARKFQTNRSKRFSSYAVRAIRSAMRDENCRHTGVTRTHRERTVKIGNSAERLSKSLGRRPTLEEIGVDIGVSTHLIEDSLQKGKIADPFTLDQSFYEDGDSWLASVPADESPSMNDLDLDLSLMVERGELSPVQAQMIYMTLEGFTKKDISSHLQLGHTEAKNHWSNIKDVLGPLLGINPPSDVQAPVDQQDSFSHEPKITIPDNFGGISLKHIPLSLAPLLVVLSTGTALAAPIPIEAAIQDSTTIKVSDKGELLSFEQTDYRVVGAYPNNPRVIRVLTYPDDDGKNVRLMWTPGSKGDASVVLSLQDLSGQSKKLAIDVRRSKDGTVKTAFISRPVEVAQAPEPELQLTSRPTPNRKVKAKPKPVQIAEAPSSPISVHMTPDGKFIRPDWPEHSPPLTKPITIAVKSPSRAPVSVKSDRVFIAKSSLNNYQLAHHLLKGLHKAKNKRHINNWHPNYLKAQTMAALLNKKYSVSKALAISGLSDLTFNNLLGYADVK
ncbi:sigma-70 family RNA polymerase sigma factor (plasmid) [Acaryochloris sp. 'Moss Beach']|uniref:sigma-70 family RNA polymerase sigma factor n=1 Tax=Acaryochloris sp. 'Moss Beach' TaxID=2740837 RepID=UPI001F27EF04|nr:sigma-70 family RNA polymerase sigma factor [Acaryochloris sp. 'Moss Beach']UJB73372.1 sigma-70 family RNA polymerase sigma factor [Acaryochloris sp. 'Moss Beach']